MFYFTFLIMDSCTDDTMRKYFSINYLLLISRLSKVFRKLIVRIIVGLPKVSEDKKKKAVLIFLLHILTAVVTSICSFIPNDRE